jgi:hypothetical protein
MRSKYHPQFVPLSRTTVIWCALWLLRRALRGGTVRWNGTACSNFPSRGKLEHARPRTTTRSPAWQTSGWLDKATRVARRVQPGHALPEVCQPVRSGVSGTRRRRAPLSSLVRSQPPCRAPRTTCSVLPVQFRHTSEPRSVSIQLFWGQLFVDSFTVVWNPVIGSGAF